MALILAVDAGRQQDDALDRLRCELGDHEFVSAASIADALAAMDRRMPDLVLLSPFLPEAEEEELLSRFRMGSGAGDVRALTIPLLKDTMSAPASPGIVRRFLCRRASPSSGSGEGCEPRAFADRIREYLASVEGVSPRREVEKGGVLQFPLRFADPSHRALVIAAASAAASWARARRAAWDEDARSPTEASLPADRSCESETAPPTPCEPIVQGSVPVLVDEPIEEVKSAQEPGPSAVARVAARTRSIGGAIARRFPQVAAAAVVLAICLMGRAYWVRLAAAPKTGIVVFESAPAGSELALDGRNIGVAPMTVTVPAGTHTVEFRLRNATRTEEIVVAAGSRSVQRVDWTPRPTGTLLVGSEPAGSRVLVDGTMRGVTPLTIEDLSSGPHVVVLESTKGRVERSVTINTAETVRLDELIFAGWLAVFAPFEVAITEGGRAIRLDDRNQVMLPPGPHELRLENRQLGYEAVRRVDVKPGELTSLSVAPPSSALTVTATAPAEVWLDRVLIGQTPLVELPVELGTRDVVVKSAAGDERRFTVTVTVKPVSLTVDFSSPASHSPQG